VPLQNRSALMAGLNSLRKRALGGIEDWFFSQKGHKRPKDGTSEWGHRVKSLEDGRPGALASCCGVNLAGAGLAVPLQNYRWD
jgi:hypothetical protein